MTKNTQVRLLICGRSTIDIIMRVDKFSDQAIKQFSKDLNLTVGGPAANAAIAAARHGGDIQLATKMGADQFGQFLADRLVNENIKLLKEDRNEGSRSSLSVALIDEAGERQTINFGGSGFIFSDILSGLEVPDLVLTDNRYPELARAGLDFARKNNLPAVMDAEAPFDLNDALNASHIAFSMQGFRSFMPQGSIEESLRQAQNILGSWLCVTDGPNGVWIADHEHVHNIPAFSIEAVDTVGAGDIWHGVFALQLARGKKETDAVRYANAAAALKCRKFGGIDSCPYTKDTEAFLQEAGDGTHSR